jgi:hypothetical protein
MFVPDSTIAAASIVFKGLLGPRFIDRFFK